MWGFGGRYYWGKKDGRGGRKAEGIVVLFAWMSSEERHLKRYLDLYASVGWDCLVCHSQFLNSFFPERAASLALELLNELVEDLKRKPCPVVFASFSGGPKACMYKVLQIIEGKHEAQHLDNYQLVRDCVAGHIYDSSPVDFTSDLGTRFVCHPTVLRMSHSPRLVRWTANGIASALDALFLSRFESQRAEYWQTLYSSVGIGVPYLILCSEDDELAPCQTICNFAHRLGELGGDVNLVKWNSSPHVGHYREHPVEYEAAVKDLLGKASMVYSKRFQMLKGEQLVLEGAHNASSEPFSQLRKAGAASKEVLGRVPVGLTSQLVLPCSPEDFKAEGVGSLSDGKKRGLLQLASHPPSFNANGIMGEIPFDVCVSKVVEDWDIRPSGSLKPLTRRHTCLNPIKYIRRSRL